MAYFLRYLSGCWGRVACEGRGQIGSRETSKGDLAEVHGKTMITGTLHP